MHRPVSHYRQRIQAQIASGKIRVGEEVAKTYTRYSVDKSNPTLAIEGSARKIPLLEIREKLLKKHQEMKLIRDQADEHFDALSAEEIKSRLKASPLIFR